jgi:hypothetical protein
MRWMDSCCNLLMVKPESILIGCIISFQWNHGMYELGYVQIDSIHSGHLHSCWPVKLTVYNLSLGMCIRLEFMFLSMVIPSPNSPSRNIDVFLQPLIDELNWLWSFGTSMYDVSRKYNFQMKATLMWTINDFPTYDYQFISNLFHINLHCYL